MERVPLDPIQVQISTHAEKSGPSITEGQTSGETERVRSRHLDVGRIQGSTKVDSKPTPWLAKEGTGNVAREMGVPV
jgi:hypothetical protein